MMAIMMMATTTVMTTVVTGTRAASRRSSVLRTSYFAFLQSNPDNAPLARTMALSIIMLSNLFLVQVNSSNTDFAFQSFIRLIKDKIMLVVNIGTIVGLLLIVYSPINSFLKLAPLSLSQLLLAAGIACVAVLWYEVVKLIKKIAK